MPAEAAVPAVPPEPAEAAVPAVPAVPAEATALHFRLNIAGAVNPRLSKWKIWNLCKKKYIFIFNFFTWVN